MRKKLGEILVEAKLIDDFQLQASLGHQRQWGGRLGEILVNKGFASGEGVADCLAVQLRLDRFELKEQSIDARAAGLVAKDLAERKKLLPFRLEGDRGEVLWIAMHDPTDLATLDELQFQTGKRLRIAVASEEELNAAIAFVHSGTPIPKVSTAAELSATTAMAEEVFGAGTQPQASQDEDSALPEMTELEPLEEVTAQPVDAPFELAGFGPPPVVQPNFGEAASASARPSPSAVEVQPNLEAETSSRDEIDVDDDFAALGLGDDLAEARLPASVELKAPEPESVDPLTLAPDPAQAPQAAPALTPAPAPAANGLTPQRAVSPFADGSTEQLIVEALDKLAAGEAISEAAQRFVNPTQLSAALVRLLIRKGVIEELELIESLQEK